jgi:3D (Asp-Asp-Asp) domain-containing protein
VRRLARLQARLLAAVLYCAICGVVGTASGAATPASERRAALRQENAAVTQRMHGAILDLYALDSRLKRGQAELESLGARRERIARERRSIRTALETARRNLETSHRQVAVLVRTMYEEQTDDALSVVLGAESLEQAVTTLDDLGRVTRQHRQIAARSRAALISLHASMHALAREDARLSTLQRVASKSAAALATAEAGRRHYISMLSARRDLTRAQLSRIATSAESSAATGIEISQQAAPALAAAGRTVTVVATGYSMGGTTATGVPAGWGTVAVDPSVISLGSRLTIPGYGEGVAADTGSAVRGATVDVWFPTLQQALAWGRRVVTVTLH